MNKLISTGEMIHTYLESNNVSVNDLAKSCGVSLNTINRFLNNNCKLSYDVAVGLNRLIPEISIEFLMSYDAKYQKQKRNW